MNVLWDVTELARWLGMCTPLYMYSLLSEISVSTLVQSCTRVETFILKQKEYMFSLRILNFNETIGLKVDWGNCTQKVSLSDRVLQTIIYWKLLWIRGGFVVENCLQVKETRGGFETTYTTSNGWYCSSVY